MLRLFSFAVVCLVSYAQSPLGTVTGVVTDPMGAVIPNAKVTVRNLDTGLRHETNTNATGVYSFPNLPPGNYKINVQAAGFQSFRTTPLALLSFRTFLEDIQLVV